MDHPPSAKPARAPGRQGRSRYGRSAPALAPLSLWLAALLSPTAPAVAERESVRVEGRIVDARTGTVLPGRLYILDSSGKPFLARSAASEGSAVSYRKERGRSTEVHTTLSAHSFFVELPAGTYTFIAERGKEYVPARVQLEVGGDKVSGVSLELRRWVNMAARGWYSGDTHVHRSLKELPNLLLAEDLNVAFPLTSWVTRAHEAPDAGDRAESEAAPRVTRVDATHVFYPRNTEYEIFTVGDKRHELGAVFLLNHKTPFRVGTPPVGPLAEQTHREGGLVELDKHAWPWSMMLVPVMRVDLYELANNHHWRTEFLFAGWGASAAPYMKIERDERGWTEWGWTDFGFQNYYALLNCGFRLRPTAGTASGVHPVPLGFGRVYVHLEDGFTYERWVEGLNRGRSFVTTGPMLFVEVNDKKPGHTFRRPEGSEAYRIRGSVLSETPLTRLEVMRNGEIEAVLRPLNRETPTRALESPIEHEVSIEDSSWIAVRAIEERAGGRIRFAHSAPFYVEVPERPVRPRREEVNYLIRRVQEQIERSRGVLSEPALDEYRRALKTFRDIARNAR